MVNDRTLDAYRALALALFASLVLLVLPSGCSRSGTTNAPIPSATPEGPPPTVSTSPSTPSSPPPTQIVTDAAAGRDATRCEATGEFSLTDLLADPACALANDDPRVKVVNEGRAAVDGSLVVDLAPRVVEAKGGAAVELEVRVTSQAHRGTKPVELVVLVRPEGWFAVDARAKAAGAPEALRLVGKRGPTFAPTERRPAWWARVTMAPGSVGRTRVAFLAVSRRVEHLPAPPGVPAPYADVEVALPAGTYSLDVTEPLLGKTTRDRATLTITR